MARRLSKKQLELIEQIERRCQMVREFMNDWLLFNQILSEYPRPGANKAQLENQFLKIKSKLARAHNVLKEALAADYKLDSNTMNIVSSATSLEQIYAQSEVAVKKLQTEWHRAFISINETLGIVEDKKARAEAGEKIYLMPVGGGGGPVGGGGMSPKAKKNLLIVVVVLVVIGIMAGVPQIRNMYIGAFQDLFGG